MRKLLKICFYSVCVLVLLSVLGSFLVVRFINPNEYKAKIAAIVHEKTGRDLSIKGDISLSFFPWLGVRVHDVALSNAKGFMPENFASMGEADVSIKLMPLLSRQVEVGKVTLRNLTLNLAKNKQGVTNWEDLGAVSASSHPIKPANKTLEAAPKKSSAMLLSIAGVNVEKSRISWVDAEKNQTVQLADVNIESNGIAMGRAFPLKMTFAINSTKPEIAGNIALNANVLLDQAKATYQLDKFRVDFSPIQKNLQALLFRADRVWVDLRAQKLNVVKGVLSQGNSSADLSLKAQKIVDNPTFEGDLQATQFNLKALLNTLGQPVATDSRALEAISLQTHFAGSTSSVIFDPFNANIYKGTMRGKVAIDLRGAAPSYRIDENLSNIDMTQLIQSGRVVGQANVEAHLTLQGKGKADILRSLNGQVRFNVQNGALLGKNIPYEVERAVSLFKRQPTPPAPAMLDRTSFSVLQGTGTFNAGVFSNNDLLIQSPEFRGKGSGVVNLADESLNYHLEFVGLQTTSVAGKTTEEERKTPIPIVISGTFDKPIVTPDLQVLMQGELGKKAVQKIEETLGPDAGRAVGGLLEMLQK